jgi:hypothetical protein
MNNKNKTHIYLKYYWSIDKNKWWTEDLSWHNNLRLYFWRVISIIINIIIDICGSKVHSISVFM